MLTLPDLQHAFTEFLLSPPGTHVDAALCGAIRERGVPAEQRLAVYKNNVYSQLIGALELSYPAVHRLTGDEFFRFAAVEYLLAHPPQSPTLPGFGKRFPGFLEGFEPANSVPYLADVARLENLYLEAYHAAEAVPLPKAAFAEWLAEGATPAGLQLHPSARLMTSPFPVSRIWELNVRSAPIEGKRRFPGGEEHLLIVRPRATVEVRRISRGAHAALAAIGQGLPVTGALTAAAEADPDTDVAAHLLSLAGGETFRLREKAGEPRR